MKLYSENQHYKLFQGNMLDLGEVIESCSIDSIVTDPPYELNFMGKGWDNSGIAFQKETRKKCLDVLKPGGYLLAFGGSRTYHRIACAIEDAGFEIRDCIMWLYGSGFPKSMNIGHKVEDYKGWGTSLKPSYEPIIVARKPCEGSCTDNVIKYGVGGINIDECRVDTSDNLNGGTYSKTNEYLQHEIYGKYKKLDKTQYEQPTGRFPANTILTYGDDDREEVCGGFPNTKSTYNKDSKHETEIHRENADTLKYGYKTRIDSSSYNDEGSAARYFYCAKASKRDRDEGLNTKGEKVNDGRNTPIDNPFQRGETIRKNTHPTVKPTDLMQYLVRLVTPNGGTVLDPFNGSGSTGKAVMYENKDRNKNYKYIGIELTEEYLPIAKARIEHVITKGVETEQPIEVEKEQSTEQRKETALF